MFGGLFVGYLIYHSLYPAVFKNGSHTLDWKMGAVNTVVLLISSFTMAAAINFVQRGLHKIASIMLILTIACAAAFMVIKYFEYTHKFHVGTVPGKFSLVDPTCGTGGNRADCETKIGALLKSEKLRHENHVSEEEAARLQAVISRPKWEMFYGFYFIMTGLHGVHVVVGALMIFWILIKTLRRKVGPEYYTPVEGVGLFWHVVDLVWIYLFPLLYLVG
ncbi:cytochrome c oxidase subunit III [Leptospira kobayashii]|uniref:Cytochrome c oxidase subunit III n=2 Tax=Leptospira kobayashii TaxID=1917830 RepID=A0ABN6KFT0_9LEPT|nr:cytochrome c oxidase subunit III [Leptospira kobayashii]